MLSYSKLMLLATNGSFLVFNPIVLAEIEAMAEDSFRAAIDPCEIDADRSSNGFSDHTVSSDTSPSQATRR